MPTSWCWRSSATAPRNCRTTICLHIRALGFRGEALPSIGAVSRLRLVSRPAGAANAWAIAVEAGDKSAPEPAAAAAGTRVEVRDLFFATPARLKFLKTARTERELAVDMVRRLAMAYPQIAFNVAAEDQRVLLRLPAAADRRCAPRRLARPRLRREFARDRGRARRFPPQRPRRPADPEPGPAARPVPRRQRPPGARQAAWSARCAAPIRICWRATATRSWPCSSTAPRTRSTSTSTRPRPKSGFATPPWCAG